jgi:hypothetical protein
MGLALVQSRALLGLQAPAVTVEVHLANGLPSFTLVGLADVEVKEARERVRAAIVNAGLEFPNNQRITVNLAPADLPKDSGRFDLPIALGILAASGQIDAQRLADYEFAGELSLTGALRPVRGALATALALQRQQQRVRLVLPPDSALEAALCRPSKSSALRICWMWSGSSSRMTPPCRSRAMAWRAGSGCTPDLLKPLCRRWICARCAARCRPSARLKLQLPAHMVC